MQVRGTFMGSKGEESPLFGPQTSIDAFASSPSLSDFASPKQSFEVNSHLSSNFALIHIHNGDFNGVPSPC